MSKIKVQQVKSSINRLKNQKLTLIALGLKKRGQTVILPDNKSVMGMVNTVKHLVSFEKI